MVTVRPERPQDVPAINTIHKASFPSLSEARLVDSLRATGKLCMSLVAEIGDVVVGHVAFSTVTVESGYAGAGLGPIAVADAHRRHGIAAELVRAGLDACRQVGFGWAVVLGDPAYYRRFGFRPASEFGLSDEFAGGSAFQALELIPDALPVDAGLVRYAPEFAALA